MNPSLWTLYDRHLFDSLRVMSDWENFQMVKRPWMLFEILIVADCTFTFALEMKESDVATVSDRLEVSFSFFFLTCRTWNHGIREKTATSIHTQSIRGKGQSAR